MSKRVVSASVAVLVLTVLTGLFVACANLLDPFANLPVATPQITPRSGTYTADQAATITDTTAGATIYYTTDGTDPTTTSNAYTDPIAITGDGTSTTIKAIASKAKMTASSIATSVITIGYSSVAAPQFSPSSGTFSSDQSISISDATPGATIYYTTNGTDPTNTSTKYDGTPIPVTGDGTTMTFKAYATNSDMKDSGVTTAAYAINYGQVSTPAFGPASGTYHSDQLVTITEATPGATVYYTTDGTTPTVDSTAYDGNPVSVAGDGTSITFKAIAIKNGMTTSEPVSASYTIAYLPQVKTPRISPVSATYLSAQTIEITDDITGSIIYFTADGSTPTTKSNVYTSSITAGKGTDMEIKAFAIKSGMVDSTVASANYLIPYVITKLSGTDTAVSQPYDVAADTSGDEFIADTAHNVIEKVDSTGAITIFAGSNTYVGGFAGDGGLATSAELYAPHGVAVDSAGNVYIADTDNNRIRKIDTSGNINTIAGIGNAGFSGDGGAATDALLNGPTGVAVDSAGNIYIADTNNNRIRKIDTAGNIDTIAGTDAAGYSGDGGLAVDAQLNAPTDVAVDAGENVFIADSGNNVIRKIDVGGYISTFAGSGTAGYAGDRGPATGAELNAPTGVAVDDSGNVYIADSLNNRVRKVNALGVISTIAGTGAAGSSGDGDVATKALLNAPRGVEVDTTGNVFIADTDNNRIRELQ